ncbi:hypothetical protein CES85_3806 (plasmid) [Ochrobactrum quorumnocens]|uniref:Uncharacterized protein n=1 Tax=Ochrobactrum quorumnocens TaxID=271865 RepID=A0A248UNR3_9HYPH|nr:hypothetical protein CES85_5354 [[Ochrobactrum] quorumnocens]ASV88266.1 hypothetical protein CES85_3806 [[Ochrobactrum] quorumnocens]
MDHLWERRHRPLGPNDLRAQYTSLARRFLEGEEIGRGDHVHQSAGNQQKRGA